MAEIAPPLPRITEANRLHGLGIDAATQQHDYALAHKLYGQALNEIDEVVTANQENPRWDRFDPNAALVQRARIQRDAALAHLRQARGESGQQEKAGYFTKAKELLVISENCLWSLTDGGHAYQDNQEVLGEYGASVNAHARLTTIDRILHQYEEGPSEAGAAYPDRYEAAHTILRRGSNKYYLVNNAMIGARDKLIFGTKRDVMKWLGRAAFGLAEGAGELAKHAIAVPVSQPKRAAKDRVAREWSDLKAAAKTIKKRIPHLRSSAAARASAVNPWTL